MVNMGESFCIGLWIEKLYSEVTWSCDVH